MLVDDEHLKQKVVRALLSDEARTILSAVTDRPLSVNEMSNELHIPLGSAYRRVNELVEAGLLISHRSILNNNGIRYSVYRSTVESVRILFEKGRMEVELVPVHDMVHKFTKWWSSLGGRSTVSDLPRP